MSYEIQTFFFYNFDKHIDDSHKLKQNNPVEHLLYNNKDQPDTVC